MHHVFYVMTSGRASDPFDVVPGQDWRVEGFFEKDLENIKARLRYDRERGLTPGPGSNPSISPFDVKFIYKPWWNRLERYRHGFPYTYEGYQVVDAFVCLGSRFGLAPVQVVVELCVFAHDHLWANVYYVADSMKVEMVIEIARVNVPLETEDILQRIQRDRDDEAAMQARILSQRRKSMEYITKRFLQPDDLAKFANGRLEIQKDQEPATEHTVREIVLVDDSLLVSLVESLSDGSAELGIDLMEYEYWETGENGRLGFLGRDSRIAYTISLPGLKKFFEKEEEKQKEELQVS